MKCSFCQRVLPPEEVGDMLMDALLTTASIRNEAHPDLPEVQVALQTSTPEKIAINAFFPLKDTVGEDISICSLEINREARWITFHPKGSATSEEYPLSACMELMVRMHEAIRTS